MTHFFDRIKLGEVIVNNQGMCIGQVVALDAKTKTFSFQRDDGSLETHVVEADGALQRQIRLPFLKDLPAGDVDL